MKTLGFGSLFGEFEALLLTDGKLVTTNEMGEMCSPSCRSAASGLLRRGHHSSPKTTHRVLHNFDFH